MRRLVVIGLAVVGLSACGPSPATPSPSTGSREPVVECLGGLDQPICDTALQVVLDAVAPSGWTPTNVWLNSGALPQAADLLFDPHANFPMPNVSDLGTQVGNAEVAFAETEQHAGINLYAKGSAVAADLIGYAIPRADWCSGTCPTGSSVDGPFRLELVLSRLDWKAGEPITGTAILSFDGPTPITITGSGTVLGFAYAEVGGTRKVDPVWTADCAQHVLDPATPINADLGKSGAVSDADPNAGFLRSFLTGPGVRLPAGTWDVSTLTMFTEGSGCTGGPHSMTASLRITVSD